MTEAPFIAHSPAEVNLYVTATPCPSCRKGPLKGLDAESAGQGETKNTVSVDVTCSACQASTTFTFQLPEGRSGSGNSEAAAINDTDEASRIIDVAQWITLSQVLNESARHESDKIEVRRRSMEAARCLDEALKFFDDVGNDLPPPEAFFHDQSRRRFKDNPEEFSRQRLINLRSRLPSPSAGPLERSSGKSKAKSCWWRREP